MLSSRGQSARPLRRIAIIAAREGRDERGTAKTRLNRRRFSACPAHGLE
jgi:hypothetical protein